MGRVITVTNQKGGVGKTTATCHIAFAASEVVAARPESKVLVVDLCGQGNTSQNLTGNLLIQKQGGGAEQLFEDEEFQYSDTVMPNVKLLHGHLGLESLDKDPAVQEKAWSLREKIRSLPFDYIIFDTPPALGMRIAAPLLWSDLVVLMAEAHISSLTGLDDTFGTIKEVKRRNRGLAVRMAVNRFTKSSKTQRELRALLQQKFGSMIIEEFAARTPVADAIQNNVPVWKYSKDKALGEQWRNFAINALK